MKKEKAFALLVLEGKKITHPSFKTNSGLGYESGRGMFVFESDGTQRPFIPKCVCEKDWTIFIEAPTKMWQWIIAGNDDAQPSITNSFYPDKESAIKGCGRRSILDRADWTEKEF